jgi:hypothetical protein
MESNRLNPLKTVSCIKYIQIQFVPHRKHYVSATKPNRLMLFRETVALYCENHMEHTNTLCGQNVEFYCVNAGGTYSNYWALKG